MVNFKVIWDSNLIKPPGNVFVKFADIEERIEDPKTGDLLNKAVFIVFYQVTKRVVVACGVRNLLNKQGLQVSLLLL